MNIDRREYADNGDANKDILGIADIGPAIQKGAREAIVVIICMSIRKDTAEWRKAKVTLFMKMTVRT